jgi:hypothetical protein
VRTRPILMIPIFIVAILTHTATIIFLIFIFIGAHIASDRTSDTSLVSKKILLVGTGFITSLLIGPLREPILMIIGDRRAIYDAPPTDIGYASYWIFLLIASLTQGKRFFEDSRTCIAIICLTTFCLATIFHIQSTRFISAVFPFVISLIPKIDPITRLILIPISLSYIFIQWIYWLR